VPPEYSPIAESLRRPLSVSGHFAPLGEGAIWPEKKRRTGKLEVLML
jgi:hypothetical protein